MWSGDVQKRRREDFTVDRLGNGKWIIILRVLN